MPCRCRAGVPGKSSDTGPVSVTAAAHASARPLEEGETFAPQCKPTGPGEEEEGLWVYSHWKVSRWLWVHHLCRVRRGPGREEAFSLL